MLTENSLSKKEKREAERRKKATGYPPPPSHHTECACYFSWTVYHLLTICLSEGSGSVKTGGGGNAREIRIRKTKKKGRKDEDSDEETGPSQQSTLRATKQLFLHREIMCLYAH